MSNPSIAPSYECEEIRFREFHTQEPRGHWVLANDTNMTPIF